MWIGTVAGLACVAIAYPLVYAITLGPLKRHGRLILFLVLLSLFAAYIVRIYAWRTLLGSDGIVNRALEGIGLIDHPLSFLLYTRFAVILTLINVSLPFAVVPLYASPFTLSSPTSRRTTSRKYRFRFRQSRVQASIRQRTRECALFLFWREESTACSPRRACSRRPHFPRTFVADTTHRKGRVLRRGRQDWLRARNETQIRLSPNPCGASSRAPVPPATRQALG